VLVPYARVRPRLEVETHDVGVEIEVRLVQGPAVECVPLLWVGAMVHEYAGYLHVAFLAGYVEGSIAAVALITPVDISDGGFKELANGVDVTDPHWMMENGAIPAIEES